MAMRAENVVHILDYGAGNVRSVRNAIRSCGFEVTDVKSPDDSKFYCGLICADS